MGSSQVKGSAQHHLLLSATDQSETDYTSLLEDAREAGLPTDMTWTNKDGNDYTDDVINQICGSCYAASTTSMINIRLRIKNELKEKVQLPYKQVPSFYLHGLQHLGI